MSVALYMDVHVEWVITKALRARGIDVLTAQDDGTTRLDDDKLLDRATALRRILFTRDQDFLRESHQRQITGQSFLGVIFAPQVKVSIGQCVNDLTLIALATDPVDWHCRLDYLPF